MATKQSGPGRITIFEDFIGNEWIIANTSATGMVGNAGLRVVGAGMTGTDGGVLSGEADPCLNGVGYLLTSVTDNDSTGVCTAKMFDVALMAPITMECRVQFNDLDTKEFFFGLTNMNDDGALLEGGTIHGATTVITLTATNLCGFYLSSELTEDEMWHMPYNGGTTTGPVLSTTIQSGIDAVAGDYDILRLEVDPNGTARWYINGVLEQTVAGAVSTTTDLAVMAMVQNLAGSDEYAKIDYILIESNRDWTR